ncbi:TetR/AcrR family transcriptional regulator [Nonomuraea recticatena]|uniref:TetR/AcrR family transcriptional regulator n=1 Tax=Nonomuraea recticatena TaxID=46178 RepID=UPI003622AB36
MAEERGQRRYDGLRRTAQALETRVEIARAARKLFLAQGWAETTVRDVAREAGVSVPTIYSIYGNKLGLARALADAADLSGDVPQMLAELEDPTADPARQLRAMAGFDRRLYERAGDIIVLLREAGRTEPDLGTVYRDGRRRADETRLQVFSSWPEGCCAAGWTCGPQSTSTRASASSTSTSPSPTSAGGRPIASSDGGANCWPANC